MSKYIKLEDAIHNINLEVTGRKEYTGDMKANLFLALDDLPTIEVSEDCISRERFREQMYHRCFEVDNDENMQKWDSGNWLRWKLFEEELENAPSVVPTQTNAIQHTQSVESVEPTTEQSTMVGEWIDYYYPHFEVAGIECSVCGEDIPYWDRHYKEPRFCPNCGSRMKG